MPRQTAADVLTTSRRRCCICFGLQHDSVQRKGQIAHLDHDRSNHEPDNLAFLCLEHHDQYDSRTSQSKNLTPDEVKLYRSELLTFLSATHAPSDSQLAVVFARAFDRPAFRTPFQSESSIPRFREAIEETIALINTGGSSTGATVPSKHRVHDRKLRATLERVVESLVALRASLDSLLRRGAICPCGCGDPNCPVFLLRPEAIREMDQRRRVVLRLVRQLDPHSPLHFYDLE